MLSKQAWRLIQNPSSLAAKVFKAKYYPTSSFLEAKEGHNPSFVWSSILKSQDIIRRCSRWRVGNGKSIYIWKDKWLPDQSNASVSTPPYPFLEDAKVSSIMLNQGVGWDSEVILEIFNSRDANLIMSTPLSMSNRDDKLIWTKEDRGIFSVKSCYRALVGDHNSADRVIWALIWKIKIPPKARFFFWQACVSCLPTADLLRMKKVDCPEYCQVCQNDSESIIHILVNCDLAKECWVLFNIQVNTDDNETFAEWTTQIFQALNKEQICLFIMICWYIWMARNDKVWHNRTTTATRVMERARQHLRDWREVMDEGKRSSIHNHRFTEKWKKPPQGYTKLNVDAAINVAERKTGFGWVLRDDHGEFKNAKSGVWNGLFNPKEAEAMAIREALSWLKFHRRESVQIETDALQVVHGLDVENGSSSYDLILLDIKDMLKQLSNVSISFAKRSANRVAHMLARGSFSMSDCMEWTLVPPTFICNDLVLDLV